MDRSQHRFQRPMKVAVIAGGGSAERDISLKSGEAVMAALERVADDINIDQVLFLDPRDQKLEFVEQLQQMDVAFPIMHGAGGEDGQIQALLEFLEIPYTGSGMRASAVAMDKVITKQIWSQLGLPTPAFGCFSLVDQSLDSLVEQICQSCVQLPLILKPINEGSSLWMYKIESEAELRRVLRDEFKVPTQVKAACTCPVKTVLVESWVTGQEFTVGILDGVALPSICIKTPRAFYDYHAKYVAEDTQYVCPSGLNSVQEQALQTLCIQAANSLGCQGWSRVDVMRDTDEQFWLIEVNTLPGMTTRSLVPMAAQQAGLSFDDLIVKILATAGLKQ